MGLNFSSQQHRSIDWNISLGFASRGINDILRWKL